MCEGIGVCCCCWLFVVVVVFVFFFSSRRRHTRFALVSWARRCVRETGIGLSFVQFLFVLFTSKANNSISNFNSYIIEFFHDTLAFLLFETDDKPFPFKPGHSETEEDQGDEEGEIIEAELDPIDEATSKEEPKE